MQMATGYWNSATLLAANELDIFGALADAPLTSAQIAERLNMPARSLTMLLDACAGLGLLHKTLSEKQPRTEPKNADTQGDRWTYANAPSTSAFLVRGQPGYLGDAIRWGADQYAAWGDLARGVRENGPVVAPALHLGADAEQTRRFVLGMHSRALGMARGVLHFLPFENTTHLLDVGGGPGTYAMLLAQKYPGLRVTVLDLPGVVAIAQELIAQAGLSDRIETRAGSAVEEEYGLETVDGVLFSGVLHQMDETTIRQMFAKAFRALQSGGKLIVSDIMLDASKTQPAFATLFSLQMLLTSEAGAVFAADECAAWLQGAGFVNVRVQPLPPPLPYVVIAAEKP